ncbi:MAG: polysaccharide biosynthesis protein [Odoribacter sp.]|nr:polysaccharide biosynthesis protein [Odoribacter sp.]
MRDRIIENLSHNLLVNKFMAGPTPRWLVLGVDLLIVALSCFITYTFNPDTIVNYGWWSTPAARAAVVFIVYAMVMPLVHSYRYIVRLSVVEDMYRVAVLAITSSIFLVCVSGVCYAITGHAFFDLWNVFVIGVLSSSLLMFMRLGIKYIYRQLTGMEVKRKRVIALGSSPTSFAFAAHLNNETDGSYKVVAMLTLAPDVNTKFINDIPVYHYNPDTIAQIFQRYNCKRLLFPSTQLKFMRSGVADIFLKNNIKLLMHSTVKEMTKDGTEKTTGNVRDIHIEDLLGRDVIQTDTHDVEEVLRGQTVMITGAAGSIGSEIVNQVAAMHAGEIVLLDQAETPMHELQLHMEQKFPDVKIHLFIADVANRKRIEQAFKRYRPRYIFHAAAYKHVPMMERNPSEAIMTNVLGTKNLADLAVDYDVEKFVMISTDKAVNPTNVMGASKRIAEIYVQSLFYYLTNRRRDGRVTRFITTRFGNVLGSNGSVIPLFRRQIEQGGPVTVTHRDIIRYFMTIPEACSLVLQAGTMGNGGEIYVFDMGQPVKIYDLATRMISLSGLRPGEDIEIVETGLRPGEKLYEELLNDKEMTMATRHNKIMIAKVRIYDYAEVVAHIEALCNFTEAGEYHDIVAEMKRIVPEFKSKNSVWEGIDKEIKTEEVISEITIR